MPAAADARAGEPLPGPDGGALGALPGPDGGALGALLTPEGRALVERLTPWDERSALATLAAVRRDAAWATRPEVVAAAATQARLRTRASARFPGAPRWWTVDGLEQATRPEVAARHAARFLAAGVTQVADLGCGAGSDALALAAAGLDVLAVDVAAEALWALGATAGDLGVPLRTSRADVRDARHWWNGPASPATASRGAFVDPARRRAGARVLAPEGWSPPWSWVCGLAGRVPATGAKVAPGIAHDALPAAVQAEWTSVGGDLVEAAVWWGPLRRGTARRVATVLPSAPGSGHEQQVDQLDDGDGIPTPEVGPVGAWLVEPDPAVIRAGLVSVLAARLAGRLLDPHIAYVTTDAAPAVTPFGARFAVLEEVPFARKAMRAWLRARGYGDVVVKKRGVAVVPEQLRADLRLDGRGPTATLLLTRTGAGPLALLVAPQP
ncbi:MAG TPA: hypothetical protein VF143_09780 [Candidatus Nanopelagicales bacterium]